MLFKFQIRYFKRSGKYYSETEVERESKRCEEIDPPMPYMPDVAAWLRGLRDAGGPGAMPGLASEGWDGYILLDCKEAYPILITPCT